jgi:hypothetical protein
LALDRELLASTAGVRHFWYMLKENKCTSVNDRQWLIYALHRVTGGWTARQECHLSYTAEFHVLGVENVIADTLSRPPALTTVVVGRTGRTGRQSGDSSS